MKLSAIAAAVGLIALVSASACESQEPSGAETATPEVPTATALSATPTRGQPTISPEEFVTPDAARLEPLLISGCDADWVREEFRQAGVSVCRPEEWTSDAPTEHEVLVEFPAGVLNIQPENDSLDCTTSVTFETDIGNVGACAFHPLEGGQSHQLLLPSGVSVFVFVFDDAGSDERAAAFRAAMSVERLP